MRLPALILISTGLALLPAMAFAGEVVSCGTPAPPDMIATPADGNYCDFYQRQLAYREQTLKQQELTRQRQETFAAPRRQALEQYRKDLEALNATRGAEDRAAEPQQDLSEQELELQTLVDQEEKAKTAKP
jgi:hypothetical protein